MEVCTLKNIKDALSKVPDELLENLTFGTGEGCEEMIGITAPEGGSDFDFPQVFNTINEKYPEVNDFGKLIQSIIKHQRKLDEQEDCDDYITEISSEDKFD